MSAPSLKSLQISLSRAIRLPGEATSKISRLSEQLCAPERIAVYGDGYFARIGEALEEIYPAVRSVLGEKRWYETFHTYLQNHPSTSYNLSEVGRAYPDFLRTTEMRDSFPFLSNLACLESHIHSTFHALAISPFSQDQIQTIREEDWDRARIRFQETVSVLSTSWPVFALWQHAKDHAKDLLLPKAASPEYFFIYRYQDNVRVQSVESVQYQLMDALRRGIPLGKACKAIADDTAPENLFEWFAQWMQWGLIREIRIS